MRELQKLISKVERRDYFLALNPELTITDGLILSTHTEADTKSDLGLLRTDGYVALRLLNPTEAARMALAIARLREERVHPLFAYVYDDFWKPLCALAPVARAVLGEEWEVLEDLWAWQIECGSEHAGWPPHRGVSDDVRREDGLPSVVNVWIALTEATVDNSCIHIVPLSCDRNRDLNQIDFSPEDVRALPVKAGHALLWNANVLHWGGASSARALFPRVSYSFTLQTKRRLNHRRIDLGAPLRFEHRLDLIANQILTYGDKEPIADETKKWARVMVGLRGRISARG